MKTTRFIVLSVIAMLVVILTAGTALADSPWQDKAGKGKGQQVQIKLEKQDKYCECDFSDVSPNHWAGKRIKAMAKQGIVKGYGNGKFHPNAAVSNIEALTMVVRATEDVDGDDLRDALDDADTYKGIPLWAQGYVAIALDEEILEEDDLDNFRPNAAAKRYEVAILLGKALDVDTDDDYEDLDFSDLNQIPEEALEYLPYLVEEGYITGYHNGKFMPNKPVTRAELVNMIAKVVGDIDDDDDDIDIDILDQFKASGKITEIDDDTMVLKIKNFEKEFSVDNDILVFLDNEDADFGDLEEGMKAIVLYQKTDDDNEALIIYARSVDDEDEDDNDIDEDDDEGEEIDEVEGIFKSYDDDNDTIVVRVDGEDEEYDLDGDVEVEIDGDDADLDDLVSGMEVELEIDDDYVVEISAEEQDEMEGEFVSYDADDKEITIEVDGEEFTFEVDDDVEVDIEIDGDDVDLEDLDEAIDLELKFKNGKVIKIEGED